VQGPICSIQAFLRSTKSAHFDYMAIGLVDHTATLNMDKQVLAEDISQSPIQSTDSHKGKEHPQLHIQSSDSKIKKVRDHITCSLSLSLKSYP
jgi:carbonic anhydrase